MIQYLFTILFIFTVFYTNACAQASKSYSITNIVNKTIDNGEYVDDKKIDKNDKIATSHLIYLLSPKKDSVAFYRFTDSKVSEKKVLDLYTLTKKENILLLISKNESYINQLKIVFNDNDMSVLVGNKDVFYLDSPY